MANAHVRMLPSGEARVELLGDDAVRKITTEIYRDIRRRVPVDSGELLDSIEMDVAGGIGKITVGTDYWASVEYGSEPHVIRSTGPWNLRNSETGESFGRTVNHPGTPEQPFIRPAIYKHRRI